MSDKISKIIDIPSGLTNTSVLSVIQQLNDFLKQDEINHLVINFLDTTFVLPGGLTPLLCYLRDLPRNRPGFKGLIVRSRNDNVDSYINRMGVLFSFRNGR